MNRFGIGGDWLTMYQCWVWCCRPAGLLNRQVWRGNVQVGSAVLIRRLKVKYGSAELLEQVTLWLHLAMDSVCQLQVGTNWKCDKPLTMPTYITQCDHTH